MCIGEVGYPDRSFILPTALEVEVSKQCGAMHEKLEARISFFRLVIVCGVVGW